MTEKLNTCKNCSNTQIEVGHFHKTFYAMCKKCKISTRDCKNTQTAIDEWNIKNT